MGAKQMKCCFFFGCRSSLSSNSPTHANKAESLPGQSEDKRECVDDQPKERLSTSCTGDEDKPFLHGQGDVPVHAGSVRRGRWEEQLCEQQEQLQKEMYEARKMVSSLQALLLHGSLPEDEQEVAVSVGEGMENTEQQLVILRSHLDQSVEEAQDLKKELLRSKQEMFSLQGMKDALQLRLSAQEASALQLKQELLQSSLARDQLTTQNEELQRRLEEMSSMLNEYKKDIGQKDRLLLQHKSKLDEALCTEAENSSQKLSESQNNGYPYTVDRAPSALSDELPHIRDALRSLRNSFSGHDPQHHTIDTLEQSVANIMDRLHDLNTRRPEREGRGRSPGQKANHTDRDSWPLKTVQSLSSAVLDPADSTKVLYFTDRSLTPFLINIPKRLGEVTLRDFKVAVDREGSFRYHFKAQDPEFGTVKEEVFQDEAPVPGWEGKIVAWVEQDPGDSR
ncbi:dixin-A [Conger conger]|uniref:dixin-A n=1 Tax=Conger conger TaxID=82655 RepID=UPI002A59F3D9|nr:dixin-A [Conger conger]